MKKIILLLVLVASCKAIDNYTIQQDPQAIRVQQQFRAFIDGEIENPQTFKLIELKYLDSITYMDCLEKEHQYYKRTSKEVAEPGKDYEGVLRVLDSMRGVLSANGGDKISASYVYRIRYSVDDDQGNRGEFLRYAEFGQRPENLFRGWGKTIEEASKLPKPYPGASHARAVFNGHD
ncbi:hypothetical protein [Flagellimonas sp. 2504JD4-2]